MNQHRLLQTQTRIAKSTEQKVAKIAAQKQAQRVWKF